MKITSIVVGKSVQVFEVGMPEYWKKLTISADLEENDVPENEIAALRKIVDEQLSTSPFPSGGQKQKPKMDMVVLKKYQDAMKNNDTKTIQEIENNYHVIA